MPGLVNKEAEFENNPFFQLEDNGDSSDQELCAHIL